MRVLHITKWFIPYRGGVETVVQQISEGLIARGVDTRVLTCHQQPHMRDVREHIGAVPVQRCQSFGNAFGTPLSMTYPVHYRRLASWADVIHFHAPYPVAELLHGLADLRGKQLVLTFHANPGNTRWAALETLYRPVLRRILNRVDRIVVTSPHVRDKTDLLADLRDKCEVVPLAPNVHVYPHNKDRLRQLKHELGITSDRVVLSVGRMVYYKGFRHLVAAMRQVDADLVMVGQGEELEALKQLAQASGLTGKVHFPGFVDAETLSHYYSLADVFVLPSISAAEAFGIVQVEAMAHGLPIVNTDLPTGVPFVSKHGETGLTVEPASPEALANAINTIIDDDPLRRTFAQNAWQRAERFTLDAMIDAHLRLYKQIARHPA